MVQVLETGASKGSGPGGVTKKGGAKVICTVVLALTTLEAVVLRARRRTHQGAFCERGASRGGRKGETGA
jgi:hypothetical protein